VKDAEALAPNQKEVEPTSSTPLVTFQTIKEPSPPPPLSKISPTVSTPPAPSSLLKLSNPEAQLISQKSKMSESTKCAPVSKEIQTITGKKRSYPEEFNPDPLPPQPVAAEAFTPRSRRYIPRSGFTPIRSQPGVSRPTVNQPSPVRRIAATSIASAAITDVSNSPKHTLIAGNPVKTQPTGWLERIKGISFEQTQLSSRHDVPEQHRL
jgi:hypothetical protein